MGYRGIVTVDDVFGPEEPAHPLLVFHHIWPDAAISLGEVFGINVLVQRLYIAPVEKKLQISAQLQLTKQVDQPKH